MTCHILAEIFRPFMQVVGQKLYIKFVHFEVVGMDMGPYFRVTLFGKFHYTYLRLSAGVYFCPFFGPLIISLRLGYLKAVSTNCWQTVSTSEVITIRMSSVLLNYSVVLKSQ